MADTAADAEAGDGLAGREQWGSRAGFLLAAIGSAVGLGNIWRYPFVAYENGGGAFFVPYLIALATAGLPLLILEYALGHRFRGSAPLAFRRLDRRAEWVGWWQVGVSFVIATYYTVVLAWAAAYAWYSIGTRWGDDPAAFFTGTFLDAGEPGTLGGPVLAVLIPLVLMWTLVLGISALGVRGGIERANRVMIPLLAVLFLALVVRAVTLDGATQGLQAFFEPDFSRITDGSVWVAAYGQIFFTLSIGFAIMITYASYLPRRSDLTNSALIAGFANGSFELTAGIGVFAALGFVATQQGVAVDEVVASGVGLAFIAFPEVINTLPALNGVFGLLFFGSLVLAGLSSLISVVETFVAGVQEKFDVPRRRAVLLGGGAAAVLSLAYATQGGLFLLDTVDYFINNLGIAVVGLVELVVVAWALRALPRMRAHANLVSDVDVGTGWTVALAGITPVLLGWQLVDTVRTLLAEGYEGYPGGLLGVGAAAAGLAVVAAVAVSLTRWREDVVDLAAYEASRDPAREAATTR